MNRVRPAGIPGVSSILLSDRFRIIATVNDADLDDIVFPISEGLARRFLRIELPGASQNDLLKYLELKDSEKQPDEYHEATYSAIMALFSFARDNELLDEADDTERLRIGVAYFKPVRACLRKAFKLGDKIPADQVLDIFVTSLRAWKETREWKSKETPRSPGKESLSANAWAKEIGDYLLGRMANNPRSVDLENWYKTKLEQPPILRWWIFEGKPYPALDGSLAGNLKQVVQQATQLRTTFNPRLRLSDRPDGVVDWSQTLARGLFQVPRQYMVRSSGIGLDENEYQALAGCLGWIRHEWKQYAEYLDKQSDIEWPDFARTAEPPFPLQRWAHVAKRSRWPLLRGIVAESLLPFIQDDKLNLVPLPLEREHLFELLCLVRVARCVAPPPRDIRWLFRKTDNEAGNETANQIKLEGVRICYQEKLDPKAVRETYKEAGLKCALEKFNVGVHDRTDIAFEFDQPRADFDGIIIEAKSGEQGYKRAVDQLRVYQAARPRKRGGSRYLIWGIIEKENDESPNRLEEWFAKVDKERDVWVFSSAHDIPKVLTASGLSLQTKQEPEPGSESQLAQVA